jgi:hypothetical protein
MGYAYDSFRTAAGNHAKRAVENHLHVLGMTASAITKSVNEALEEGGFWTTNEKVATDLANRLSALEAELHKLTFLAGKL